MANKPRSYRPVSGFVLPRFAGIATFMRLPHVPLEDLAEVGDVDIGLIGVPWDGGTTNRPGARHGPRQMREMSAMLRRGIPFSNAPGVAYEYSNFGFAILGRIVSSVAGIPYADYVRANVLRPLGMTATTLEPRAVPADRIAHGYRWEDGTWKEEPPLADGAFGPMGGMLSSITDLARYVAFHLAAWPPRDGADAGPVRRASVREMHQVWRPSPAAVSRDGPAGALQLNAGGYGFGLRVWQSCEFTHLVAHSGGLPGFGSHMRWLPLHGVGVIVFANLTYTSGAGLVDEVFAMLDRTGGLRPRPVTPSPALTDAMDGVSRLVAAWDDGLAERLAADNLFLDESKERRRKGLEDIQAKHGACRPDGWLEVENALRGRWRMACERGDLEVSITLAPTMPPKVQVLEVRPAVPGAMQPAGACRP